MKLFNDSLKILAKLKIQNIEFIEQKKLTSDCVLVTFKFTLQKIIFIFFDLFYSKNYNFISTTSHN